MFWMKRDKLVPLLHLTAVPGKKSPKGMGTHHMEISPFYYVVNGDQRKRTCTVRKYYKGKIHAKYRTVRLSPSQFESLMSSKTASEVDYNLNQIDYYVIR